MNSFTDTSGAPQTLPFVRATLTYMVKTGQKPYVETEALTGAKQPHYHAVMEDHEVEIHDGRLQAGRLSIDRDGFILYRHGTRVHDLYDDGEVIRDYYPEVERMLKSVTGSSRVVVFDHTRRTDPGAQKAARAPASRVHNDYTEQSGPERVRDVLGTQQADALANVAVAQVNVWRPIRGPVRRSPLAILDAATLEADDLIVTDLVYPDRVGEIYHLAFNPGQRWFYFPAMERDETVLIKGYDSRKDGRSRFTPHTAFEDPTTPQDAPPRESIEVRTLVFFE